MSFFLYNQNGQQAIARPFLDGKTRVRKRGSGPDDDGYPKYHLQEEWDSGTNAPSSNFIYDFEGYRFFVRDEWREVFAHNGDGEENGGSLDNLTEAFREGAEVKVAIRGICGDTGGTSGPVMDHELVVQCGPCYYNTERRIFTAGSQPVVRVRPAVPLLYKSGMWDFGWLMPRSDGFVARWLCDPYSLEFAKSEGRYPIRWFVR